MLFRSNGGPSRLEQAKAAQAARDAADAQARRESLARIETQRLAALWRYQTGTIGGGSQITSSIQAMTSVDVDGSGAKPVLLVFRDHTRWGRSAYLVLQAGDFACRPECKVSVAVNDHPPVQLAAWRPKTDEAIAIFIRDVAGMWRMANDADRIAITFPVVAGGTREAVFETSGLDASKMPRW